MGDPLTDQLALLGIKTSALIAGFSGGLSHYYLKGAHKTDRSLGWRIMDAMTMGGVGSFFAMYLAPLAVKYYNLDKTDLEITTGVGFIVGMLGVYIGQGLIRFAAGWAEKPTLPKI